MRSPGAERRGSRERTWGRAGPSVASVRLVRTVHLWLKALWFRKHWQVNWPFALHCARLRLERLDQEKRGLR